MKGVDIVYVLASEHFFYIYQGEFFGMNGIIAFTDEKLAREAHSKLLRPGSSLTVQRTDAFHIERIASKSGIECIYVVKTMLFDPHRLVQWETLSIDAIDEKQDREMVEDVRGHFNALAEEEIAKRRKRAGRLRGAVSTGEK